MLGVMVAIRCFCQNGKNAPYAETEKGENVLKGWFINRSTLVSVLNGDKNNFMVTFLKGKVNESINRRLL